MAQKPRTYSDLPNHSLSTIDKQTTPLLRLPVRYVAGNWECAYGGPIPVVDGAEAEIVISRASISDKHFLSRLTSRSRFKILEQGTALRVLLATKNGDKLSDEQRSFLIPQSQAWLGLGFRQEDRWVPNSASFVEVLVGPSNMKQNGKIKSGKGGVWLIVEGRRSVGILSSSIILPEGIFKEPAKSLNHSLTQLSEVFEPSRISHTGNVYQRFFYQETDGRWYPLELLRNAALATSEQSIAHQLWLAFTRQNGIFQLPENPGI